jgi:lipopolysaccharide/colanic/teichoic acid biosynthesis glycosyltransferase
MLMSCVVSGVPHSPGPASIAHLHISLTAVQTSVHGCQLSQLTHTTKHDERYRSTRIRIIVIIIIIMLIILRSIIILVVAIPTTATDTGP